MEAKKFDKSTKRAEKTMYENKIIVEEMRTDWSHRTQKKLKPLKK